MHFPGLFSFGFPCDFAVLLLLLFFALFVLTFSSILLFSSSSFFLLILRIIFMFLSLLFSLYFPSYCMSSILHFPPLPLLIPPCLPFYTYSSLSPTQSYSFRFCSHILHLFFCPSLHTLLRHPVPQVLFHLRPLWPRRDGYLYANKALLIVSVLFPVK